MSAINNLKIFLITYNRKKYLQNTLNQIFAADSPIKDFDITILDNASTDGSSELIEEYCKVHPNVKHIRHNINIGGNANICKAMELAAESTKEYFWILCDDDTYKFKHWQEVENAILSNRYDCILTERKLNFNSDNYPYIINTLAFLSAGIYKTKHINPTVIFNAYANIMYSFPHLALGCHLLNIKAKFYIPKYRIIKQGTINLSLKEKGNKQKKKKKYSKDTSVRGTNKEVHFRCKHVNLFSGHVNSMQMILDKKLRQKCCNVLWIGKSFIYSSLAFLNTNKLFLYNIFDYFLGLGILQKIQFLFTLFILYPLQLIIFIYITRKGIYLRLFGRVKLKLIPFKNNRPLIK